MTPARSAKPRVCSNAQLTAATTRRLLDVARRAFTKKGYAAASVEEIVLKAGVTRGALYHHFKDKKALFEAVFLELQREIGEQIQRVDRGEQDLWTGLLCGCREFLLACTQPDIRQIVILDGPAVLSPNTWRKADEAHSTYLLRARLRTLIERKMMVDISLDMLTALLNGALNDVALLVAASMTPEATFQEAYVAFETLVSGLKQ